MNLGEEIVVKVIPKIRSFYILKIIHLCVKEIIYM